jgi:general secretion pathway protein E
MSTGLPYQFAMRYGVFARPEGEGWVLLHRQQVQRSALLEAHRLLNPILRFESCPDELFDKSLEQHYHQQTQGELNSESLGMALDLHGVVEDLQHTEDLLDSDQDAPIIRLLNALIAQALKDKASDIHIETYANTLNFRFRMDGVLQSKLSLSSSLSPLVISRIKVMAKLNIAEKRLPQDGRISVQIAGRHIDVRVSTLPSNHGERVVLRLLDKQTTALRLLDLGLSEGHTQTVHALMHKPHGIILVTGPTGAGKTTTLYAVLSILNESTRNILTVEDPIEYDLPGVGQTQVNAKIGMTFARGLRAILRQDPDIVMVGEIRDLETAEIAIQASLTGHLMLSTLHTNTAIGAITRLRDMGVAPYLIASTLQGVMAQRLVRVLCSHCKEPYPADKAMQSLLNISEPEILYRHQGCEACQYTGFAGRTGLYDIILIDENLKQLIHDEAKETVLRAHTQAVYPTLFQDGVRRILTGETTVEEVLRVTEVDA